MGQVLRVGRRVDASKPLRGAGFSLLEILITFVVLAVGLLALARYQSQVMVSNSDAKARTEALNLAEAKLEGLRDQAANTFGKTCGQVIASGSDSPASLYGAIFNESFSRQWTVTPADDTCLKTVTVKVTWSGCQMPDDPSTQQCSVMLSSNIAVKDAVLSGLGLHQLATSP